jgi:hypothetical protein
MRDGLKYMLLSTHHAHMRSCIQFKDKEISFLKIHAVMSDIYFVQCKKYENKSFYEYETKQTCKSVA